MENKEGEVMKTQKDILYTKDDLLKDIYATFDECPDDISVGINTERNARHFMKVIQSIFSMELPEYNFSKDNADEIKEALELNVNNNIYLFGYTFFLSLNANFDYSWNYLRKQIDKYMKFLFEAYRFICYVVRDINIMRGGICKSEDLCISFNNLFDVKFIDDEPFVKTAINWRHFYQIGKVGSGYYISVNIGETTLLTYYRKYLYGIELLLGRIEELSNAQNDQYNKRVRA